MDLEIRAIVDNGDSDSLSTEQEGKRKVNDVSLNEGKCRPAHLPNFSSLLSRFSQVLNSRLAIVKAVAYTLVIVIAVSIDYYDVQVLKSSYHGFSIFDFFFYKPFPFFFQWIQWLVLIAIHCLIGRKSKSISFIVAITFVEVVVSTFVFFVLAMLSHGFWGGGF